MKRKMAQVFVLLIGMTVLFGALSFLRFGGFSGFAIFEGGDVAIANIYENFVAFGLIVGIFVGSVALYFGFREKAYARFGVGERRDDLIDLNSSLAF